MRLAPLTRHKNTDPIRRQAGSGRRQGGDPGTQLEPGWLRVGTFPSGSVRTNLTRQISREQEPQMGGLREYRETRCLAGFVWSHLQAGPERDAGRRWRKRLGTAGPRHRTMLAA